MDQYQYEEQMEKSFDRVLMKRLLKFAKPYWHYILLSIILLFIMTFGELARPYFIKMAIDDHIDVTGREYLAFNVNIPIEKGIKFDNKIWVEKNQAPDMTGGKLFSILQYGTKTFFVPGRLPESKENLYVKQQGQGYFIEIQGEIRDLIPIPQSKLKEFRQRDIGGLIRLSLAFFGIALGVFILNFIQVLVLQYTGQKILYDIRHNIFSHLERLSISFFDKNPVGKLVTRVTNDTETLNEMYTNVLVNLFKDIFMLVGIMIVMLSIHLKLALVVFSVIPLIAVLTVIFRINARKAHRRVRTLLSKINAFLSEHINGIKVIQIFHQENKKRKEFDEINTDYYNAVLKEMKIFAIFRPAIEFLFSLSVSLLIWYGGGQLIRGNLNFGVLYAFVSYTQMFFQPINDLTEKYNIMQSAMASSEKIFYLLDQTEIIPEPVDPRPLHHVKGKIEFKNVWFAYKKDEWVLKDVSFTINPGETIAFVGATGAGKTSIINLITRFYDIQKGEILIDGIPIKKIPKDDLRRHIGVVLQDVFLFAGDIDFNIRLNNESVSHERVKEVSRYVNADKFIERLPNKYKEQVMERGSSLSTGQRQLLAFARALAFNPSILVLDEATSNIDTETEELIQDALAKLIKGRTTIAIAHRLSTIQHADKIIVLHKGRIREMGNHQELLAKRGLYYRLYQLQYKNK